MVRLRLLPVYCLLWLCAACSHRSSEMKTISIELGVSQAGYMQRASFQKTTIAGKDFDLKDVGVLQMPTRDIHAEYKEPSTGRIMRFGPLDDFTTWADKRLNDAMLIHSFTFSIDNLGIKTHAQAQTEVDKIIAQFQQGSWKRFIPDTCPRVTGRSTILDAAGQVDTFCPVDPTLALSAEEWPLLAKQGLKWQWSGDSRIATLEVNWTTYSNPDKPEYSLDLKFETEEAFNFYTAKRRKERNADRSPSDVATSAKEQQEEIQVLEQAALRRGDHVLPR